MLTVRYDWLGLAPGDRVLDLGCGFGRHAFESLRRGATVIACDMSLAELKDVSGMFAAIEDEAVQAGEQLPGGLDGTAAHGECVNGDGTRLPFADDSFDCIIASEVLEHIPDDDAAFAELCRVLKPGGTIAVTVPAWLPERVCWAITDEFHAPYVEGGHVRIYTEAGIRSSMRRAGLAPRGAHKAHALHSPYWWIKCATGLTSNDHWAAKAYHQLLLWEITGAQPMASVTRATERALNPVLGKSLVVYARKPLPSAFPGHAGRPSTPHSDAQQHEAQR